MDTMWAVAGLAVSLGVALSLTVWCLVASARKERRRGAARHYANSDQAGAVNGYERPVHRFRGQGEAVTVAELLEEAIERGEGIRLNWATDDVEASPIQADELGQWPTVVLPKVEGLNERHRFAERRKG